MKKTALFLTLMLTFLLLCMNVSAATAEFDDYGLTVDLPDGYEYITVANASKNEETVSKFGYSVKSIKSYMNNNGIILIAVNEESREQLQIKATETDFSKGVGTLSGLSGDEKLQIAELMLPSAQYTETEIDGITYFTTQIDDAISYTTISGGELFTVTYYGDNAESAKKIVEGISFKTSSGISLTSGTTVIQIILVSVVVLIALICCIGIIITLADDFKNRDKWKNEEDKIVIKRRKH